MVMAMDAERGRLSFSTRKLEPEPGDMLKNPHKVFDNADRMAEEWRCHLFLYTLSHLLRKDRTACMQPKKHGLEQ